MQKWREPGVRCAPRQNVDRGWQHVTDEEPRKTVGRQQGGSPVVVTPSRHPCEFVGEVFEVHRCTKAETTCFEARREQPSGLPVHLSIGGRYFESGHDLTVSIC